MRKALDVSQTTVRYWLHKYDLRTSKVLTQKYCKNCGEELLYNVRNRNIFCNSKCYGEYCIKTSFSRLLSGEILDSQTVRKVLLYVRDHICEICKLDSWNNSEIPLVVDHIDGNPENDHIENLRLICCNCDAQLPTYKGKNRGSGRYFRRQRYKDGLSY